MKERGIIFNGEMVRAVLDGVKTQTRRPLKVQPPSDEYELLNIMSSTERSREGKSHWAILNDSKTNVLKSDERYFACPFGQIGDRIWVRETFASIFKDEGPVCYRATDSSMHSGAWTPSIHMPRWASRITLEITNIRVERVQDISEQDAIADGFKALPGCKWHTFEEADAGMPMHDHTACDAFEAFWCNQYGEESWSSNDWVWVIEFKRIDNQQVAA